METVCDMYVQYMADLRRGVLSLEVTTAGSYVCGTLALVTTLVQRGSFNSETSFAQ